MSFKFFWETLNFAIFLPDCLNNFALLKFIYFQIQKIRIVLKRVGDFFAIFRC